MLLEEFESFGAADFPPGFSVGDFLAGFCGQWVREVEAGDFGFVVVVAFGLGLYESGACEDEQREETVFFHSN